MIGRPLPQRAASPPRRAPRLGALLALGVASCAARHAAPLPPAPLGRGDAPAASPSDPPAAAAAPPSVAAPPFPAAQIVDRRRLSGSGLSHLLIDRAGDLSIAGLRPAASALRAPPVRGLAPEAPGKPGDVPMQIAVAPAAPPGVFVQRLDPQGRLRWERTFPALGGLSAIAVGAGGDLGLLAVGALGPSKLACRASFTVLRLDPRGETRFARPLCAEGPLLASIAVGPRGEVFAMLSGTGVVDVGLGKRETEGNESGFVARFAPSGEPTWGRFLSARGGASWLQAIAAGADGTVTVAGGLRGAMECPGLGERRDNDALVARLDEQGRFAWCFAARGADDEAVSPSDARCEQTATGLALDAHDNAYVGGYAAGTLVWGGAKVKSAGLRNGFVARVNRDGSPGWATGVPVADDALAYGASTDAEGLQVALSVPALGLAQVSARGVSWVLSPTEWHPVSGRLLFATTPGGAVLVAGEAADFRDAAGAGPGEYVLGTVTR